MYCCAGTCKRIYHSAVMGDHHELWQCLSSLCAYTQQCISPWCHMPFGGDIDNAGRRGSNCLCRVAGVFTKQQLGLLHHCIPGGIVSQEPDHRVALIFMSTAEYTDQIIASSTGTVQYLLHMEPTSLRQRHYAILPSHYWSRPWPASAAHGCLAHGGSAGGEAALCISRSPCQRCASALPGATIAQRLHRLLPVPAQSPESQVLSPQLLSTLEPPSHRQRPIPLFGLTCLHLQSHTLGLLCSVYNLEQALS